MVSNGVGSPPSEESVGSNSAHGDGKATAVPSRGQNRWGGGVSKLGREGEEWRNRSSSNNQIPFF